jgi:hypothetical protein
MTRVGLEGGDAAVVSRRRLSFIDGSAVEATGRHDSALATGERELREEVVLHPVNFVGWTDHSDLGGP